MAAPALKAAEPEAPQAPDMSKPIRLKYWKSPDTFGVRTDTVVTVGGYFVDGMNAQNGKVRELWFYPHAGFAVAVIEAGWRPNTVESEQSVILQHVILTNGHGRQA